MENSTENVQSQIFRFKFNSELLDKIEYFSKLHEHDDRKTYKEEWKKWVDTDEMSEIITAETERLNRLGYYENINNKMYRSSRYYFRKKNNDVKPRASFVRSSYNVSKEFISKMKTYIENEKLSKGFSPNHAYINFIEINNDEYQNEIQNLINNGFSNEDAIHKIKKTFKNQHYQTLHH
uniref:Uncharacterized protein n=1 Tax=viral metagenome TaxID=1070528 RepID=A0A6C0BRK5_9ZZZZ